MQSNLKSMEGIFMKKAKRVLASFIVVVLLLSVSTVSLSTYAEGVSMPEIQVSDDDLAVIEKLTALDVITNEYAPATYVTRRQMADIVTKFISLESKTDKGKSPFNDVKNDDLSISNIVTLYNMGIVSGDENGRFRPDDYVTYNEALVFIINAVGHKPFAEREGAYPTGYHRAAIGLGMLEKLSVSNGAEQAKLCDIYHMLDAALLAADVVQSYYGDGNVRYTFSESETFLTRNYNLYKYRGVVTGNELTSTIQSRNGEGLKKGYISINDKTYETDGNYGNLLGYSVDYYIKKVAGADDVLVYLEKTPKMNQIIRIDAEDIDKNKSTSDVIRYTENDDDEEKISVSNADIIYNGQYRTSYGSLARILPTSGFVEAIDCNRDGNYETLFIYEYKNIYVEAIDSTHYKVWDKITGTSYELDPYKHKVTFAIANTGVKKDFSTIVPGDILSVAFGAETEKVITVCISKESISGKIEQTLDDEYMINGTYYEKSSDYVGATLTVGLEGKFLLDMNNKIVAYERNLEASDLLYAAMSAIEYEQKNFGNEIKVRLFTQNNEFVEQELAQNVRFNGSRPDLDKTADFNRIIQALSNGTNSDGDYIVNDSYVVTFATDGEKIIEINTPEAFVTGNTGKLTTIADKKSRMINRKNGVAVLGADADGLYRKISDSCISFCVPDAGELEKLDEYSVYGKILEDHYYQPDSSAEGALTAVTNYSAYSMNRTEIPVIDAFVLRGMKYNKSSMASSSISVVTDITTCLDEDDNLVPKLYLSNGESLMLADEIFLNVKTATNKVDAMDAISMSYVAGKVCVDTTLQYLTNDDGNIYFIRISANYDSATDTLVPQLRTNGGHFYAEIPGSSKDVIVGAVKKYDAVSQQITFTSNGADYTAYTGGGSLKVYAYESATGTLTKVSANDFCEGDRFVAQSQYFTFTNVIIYR